MLRCITQVLSNRITKAQRLPDGSGYPAEGLCAGSWRSSSEQPGLKLSSEQNNDSPK